MAYKANLKNRRRFYWWSWLLAPLVICIIATGLGYLITKDGRLTGLVSILSIAGGLWIRRSIEHLFWVNNPTTGIFLTTDPVKATFGRRDTIVKYNPGPNNSYPWEQRSAENNISLVESSNDFDFVVLCTDGQVTVSGSYRIRAAKEQPVTFQAGVASVADDLRDLIIAIAVEELATKQVRTAVKRIKQLNDKLHDEFVADPSNIHKQTLFEQRFAVHVGDVTISQIEPSEDVQKTLSAVTEAAAIAQGTAIILGFSGKAAQAKALAEGRITQADIKDARDRFLAISGNLEGMDITRHEWVVSAHGIDPKLVSALAVLARNAGQAAGNVAQATGNMRGNNPKGNKRNKNRRNRNQGGSN